MNGRIDVALDLPRSRHMSVGMQAYADELSARLPRVAPDLSFATLARETTLDLSEQVRLPGRLRRLHPRLVHFLSVYAPFAAPRPFALTIHDLIHLRFPEFHKRTVGPYYALVVRNLCARAARVITDDERTVADLGRFLGVRPEKVRVVPLGVDDRFLSDVEPETVPRPFFLYVGNHRPHKDLATLFAAWSALDPALDVDLYVTGPDDLPAGTLRPRRAHGELRFLGDVGTERLARLYRSTLALVHPALSEGFGLPLLEASAVGARVIACADAVPGPLRPHVDTFPAKDVHALGVLLTQAVGRSPQSEESRRFARTFSWDRCARETAGVYREVLEETRGR